MCKVLNKHRHGIAAGAVYIGRGSKWGNPFASASMATGQQSSPAMRPGCAISAASCGRSFRPQQSGLRPLGAAQQPHLLKAEQSTCTSNRVTMMMTPVPPAANTASSNALDELADELYEVVMGPRRGSNNEHRSQIHRIEEAAETANVPGAAAVASARCPTVRQVLSA